ncbi:hypothetical protein H2199_008374 [Coniosporium tulheliwenetii]|uniref:Uncharacterized protein n=1 Tax=Coniosporium tulheliwenetii TaxID=3383036 RepID=A0ACC2YJD8_9PEZI|nr:hypothetical protein H2199_008374 [Cladosporium sp. JES 115]
MASIPNDDLWILDDEEEIGLRGNGAEDSDADSDVAEVSSKDYYESIMASSSNTEEPSESSQGSTRSTSAPSSSIAPPFVYEESCTLWGSVTLKVGQTVELQDEVERTSTTLHSGDFFRIHRIIHNLESDETFLRGARFRRTKYFRGLFPHTRNEVAMVLEVDANDNRKLYMQRLEDVSLGDVLRVRELVLTAHDIRKTLFRPVMQKCRGRTEAETISAIFHEAPLVCRWVHISTYPTAADRDSTRKNKRALQGIVRRLQQSEMDEETQQYQDHRPQRSNLSRNATRNNVVDLTGSIEEAKTRNSKIKRSLPASFTTSKTSPSKRPKPQTRTTVRRLTWADAFCCSGGATRGAVMAGVKVKWAMDHDEKALLSFASNFPEATLYNDRAQDFTARIFDSHVDILHLSPPCPYFSNANWRIAGYERGETFERSEEGLARDEENRAALFTVGPILEHCRPRVMILEQTDGLFHRHHRYFSALLRQILDAGYSLHWKIVKFVDYGLAQDRKRLVIMASAPAIPTPEFPEPTHGPGLRPYATIYDALHRPDIPATATHHDPNAMPRKNGDYTDPHSSRVKTLTTTGGVLHHSGTRNNTPREHARFCGFPDEHMFVGTKTDAYAQAGNAVPPSVWKLLVRSIKKTLRDFDKSLEAEPAMSIGTPSRPTPRSDSVASTPQRSTGSTRASSTVVDQRRAVDRSARRARSISPTLRPRTPRSSTSSASSRTLSPEPAVSSTPGEKPGGRSGRAAEQRNVIVLND